ncbi:MAG TPA: TIGR03118 family protein [Bryobacteraceae bacterium]|nr:TIGR03118 family protein [Bryobacteraceae bacterium]
MASGTGTYTGLAIDPTSDHLYAANFSTGGIDVYDSTFQATTVSGGFADPNAIPGYAPYNIQAINGLLYVEYDQVNSATGRPQAGTGLGYVDIFNSNGVLQQRLITGSALNAPWGITMAPAGFGGFGGDLLVGNFGNGEINAFNPVTGAFIGTITDNDGNPIVNPGLWALDFRTGGAGVNTNALYFTAGIHGEADGLFGSITTPEPASLDGALFGLALVWKVRRVRARRQL